MDGDIFLELKSELQQRGYSDEIKWAETLEPCDGAGAFFDEYVWVVLSSGMKNQVARMIQERIYKAWAARKATSTAFRHVGKVAAIDYVKEHRAELFAGYRLSADKLEFLKTLPWIGDITKYHLAKNLGADVVKPDRHLVRIAKKYGVDCFELCRRLAAATGMRIAAVDQVLWRAGNLGLA